jgi:hypothetical protein
MYSRIYRYQDDHPEESDDKDGEKGIDGGTKWIYCHVYKTDENMKFLIENNLLDDEKKEEENENEPGEPREEKKKGVSPSDDNYPWESEPDVVFAAWYKSHKLLDRFPFSKTEDERQEYYRAKEWIDEHFDILLNSFLKDSTLDKSFTEVFITKEDDPIKLVMSLQDVIRF